MAFMSMPIGLCESAMLSSQEFIELANLTHKMFAELHCEDFDQLLVTQDLRDELLFKVLQDVNFLQQHLQDCIIFNDLNNDLSAKMMLAHTALLDKVNLCNKGKDAQSAYGF